ncbi:MAG: hypothetical protein Q9163_003936 [Psora crenata]
MAAQMKLSQVSSRPLRGAALVMILIASYYFLNPFSGLDLPKSLPSGPDGAAKSSMPWSAPEELVVVDVEGTLPLNESHEGGARLRQATMIYESGQKNTVYERSVNSHRRHGERWFDADTILFNPLVPWTLFLPPSDFDDIHVLVTRDQNGLNAGMLMIRVHEWTVKMLAEVTALRQFQPQVELPFDDQSALLWVLDRPGYEGHFLYQPHSWWNSFGLQGKPYPYPGFLLHFAGVDCCGGESRGTIMGRWLDELEDKPDQYAVPLEDTTLPSEVSDYWAALTKGRKILQEANAWSVANQDIEGDIETARAALMQAIMHDADDTDKINAEVNSLENIMKTKGQ